MPHIVQVMSIEYGSACSAADLSWQVPEMQSRTVVYSYRVSFCSTKGFVLWVKMLGVDGDAVMVAASLCTASRGRPPPENMAKRDKLCCTSNVTFTAAGVSINEAAWEGLLGKGFTRLRGTERTAWAPAESYQKCANSELF